MPARSVGVDDEQLGSFYNQAIPLIDLDWSRTRLTECDGDSSSTC